MSKGKPKVRSPGKLEQIIQRKMSAVSIKELVAMKSPYIIIFYRADKCTW